MSSQRHVKIPHALLMVLALTFLLLQSILSLRKEDIFSMKLDDEVGGRLFLSSLDPTTTFITSSNNNTISIYLHVNRKPNPGYSIFKTDTLPRFGSGSIRQYAFNAIFSKTTNSGREYLASILEDEYQRENRTLPIYTSIADQFNRIHSVVRAEGQLNPHSYTEVLLDSVFTLAPAGHNPECYRMYEAVEAGSIPVFVKDDLYITEQNMAHPCREALYHWYDAPILVLDSWDELYPSVESLMNDLAALDEIQTKLTIWYDGNMRRVVREFEDFMIEPS